MNGRASSFPVAGDKSHERARGTSTSRRPSRVGLSSPLGSARHQHGAAAGAEPGEEALELLTKPRTRRTGTPMRSIGERAAHASAEEVTQSLLDDDATVGSGLAPNHPWSTPAYGVRPQRDATGRSTVDRLHRRR